MDSPLVIPKLNEECIESKLLYEKKGSFKVFYQQYKAMWPVDNRDFVLVHYVVPKGDKIYLLTKSCDYPYPEVNGVVRG